MNLFIDLINYSSLLDDLEISPDFLDYFHALYPLMIQDKTIWCISAWNDNGIDQKIDRQACMDNKSIKKNSIIDLLIFLYSHSSSTSASK
jgi:hypothetical protein